MKFTVKHEIKNRIRIHLAMKRMTFREADTFEYYLKSFDEIKEVRVYERTADAAVVYDCDRSKIALGIAGIMPPAASAMLHNGSTVALGLNSMRDLLP